MIEIVVPLGPIAALRISGKNTQDVRAQLTDVERSEIPSILGRVIAATGAQESLGRNLGAQLIEEQPLEQEPEQEEQQPSAPAKPPAPAPAEGVVGTGLVFTADPTPDWAQVPPGAPVVHGQPAWLVTDNSSGQSKLVFVQPQFPGTTVDLSLPTTTDPDDPRILEKTARFYRPLN